MTLIFIDWFVVWFMCLVLGPVTNYRALKHPRYASCQTTAARLPVRHGLEHSALYPHPGLSATLPLIKPWEMISAKNIPAISPNQHFKLNQKHTKSDPNQ